MLCPGLTNEVACFGVGHMAVRLWGSGVQGLVRAGSLRILPSSHLYERFSAAKAALVTPMQMRALANSAAALEEPLDSGKKRLSRQERAALVESFVLKHMDSNQGEFPSVTVVLKGTGGGRNAVKDILTELEKRYKSSSSVLNASGSLTGSTNSSGMIDDQSLSADFDLRKDAEETSGLDQQIVVCGSLLANLEGDTKAGVSSVVIAAEGAGSVLVEAKAEEVSEENVVETTAGLRRDLEEGGLRLTNGQMTGSTKGEIETHSGLWARLRGIGTSQSQKQGFTKQPCQQSLPSRTQPSSRTKSNGGWVSMRSADEGSMDSVNEGEDGPEFAALDYPEPSESDHQNISRLGGASEKGFGNGSKFWKDTAVERHGLFVRYLSPQASADDMKEAFEDCGEIVRAQAIKSRTNSKFTYGFVDFKTPQGLRNALDKEKVYIKGVRIQKEPSSSTRGKVDRALSSGAWASDSRPFKTGELMPGSPLGVSRSELSRNCGYTVSVGGLPLHVPLIQVENALSKYGEIVRSEMTHDKYGACCAHLDFKTEEARESAVAANSVQLSGIRYQIVSMDLLMTPVVRLTNVGGETNEGQIAATCKLFGRVEKVVPRTENMVDVYFLTSEMKNMSRILHRLNEVTMEERRWQAQLAPRVSPGFLRELSRTLDGPEWLHLQSERVINKMENAIKHLTVDVEDLRELVKAEHLISLNDIRRPASSSLLCRNSKRWASVLHVDVSSEDGSGIYPLR